MASVNWIEKSYLDQIKKADGAELLGSIESLAKLRIERFHDALRAAIIARAMKHGMRDEQAVEKAIDHITAQELAAQKRRSRLATRIKNQLSANPQQAESIRAILHSERLSAKARAMLRSRPRPIKKASDASHGT